MGELYVMRRANGDLLAVEIDGQLRIPIWSSEDAVARYKALNPELMVFWPIKLDRSIMKRVESGLGREGTTEFFLLSDNTPEADLEDGRPVTLEEVFSEASAAQSAPVRS